MYGAALFDSRCLCDFTDAYALLLAVFVSRRLRHSCDLRSRCAPTLRLCILGALFLRASSFGAESEAFSLSVRLFSS